MFMFYSEIVTSVENSDSLRKFVNDYGLVQHSIQMKAIYKNTQSEFKYIICTKRNGEIVGVFPFIHYHSNLEDVIHSMPFIGYGGGCLRNDDSQVLKSMIGKLVEYAEENRILLINICTPPFLAECEVKQYKELFQPDFIYQNFYQYMHLKDDVLSNMTSKNRNNFKRNLRIAEKNSVYLKEDYSEPLLLYWYNHIYIQRMMDTGGAIYPYGVFNEMRLAVGGERLIIQYAMLDETVIGAGFFLKQQKSLDNFMRVIDPNYIRTNAGVLLDYWSIKYAKKQGFTYYNWQSCDRIDSPIYKYKKAWGSQEDQHFYLTKLIRPVHHFKQIPLEEIKKEYKGIYVMPYSEFG